MPREQAGSPEREFEQIVVAILRANNISAEPGAKDQGYDILLRKENLTAAAELKLYPTFRIAWNTVRRAFDQLSAVLVRSDIDVAILVTNARIAPALRGEAFNRSIVIIDYDVLGNLAAPFPELASKLEHFLQEAFTHRSEPLDEYIFWTEIPFISAPIPPKRGGPTPPAERPLGNDLCKALRATEEGKGTILANIFGDACENALRYLFGADLIGWKRETPSHSNLHYYDLSARIASKNDFWNAMVADHRTRYIIFEFKNYKDKLNQIPIYTTEKYLFPIAMRSTAIVVSRYGIDDNAFRVTAGALREAGKIILSLNTEDVCKMLHLKDDAKDPTIVISDKLDELLRGLER